ncbi:MAG: signal peptidase I [Oscillospiraceae bacterium]|nr:signal peptidase I [Oscillospiraceae bacterium]
MELFRKKNVTETEEPQQKRTWQQNLVLDLKELFYVLAVFMIIYMLFFRVVVVVGPSMYNTLVNGDRLLLISSTFYTEPKQGDIIVASKKSFENGECIVKRVIATEGQTVDIDFQKGIVYVDGVALEEDYTYTATTLFEGVSFPLYVEEGHVFVLGDNRNSSKDSRNPQIGLIDEREILGKAIFLMAPGVDGTTEYNFFDRFGVIE